MMIKSPELLKKRLIAKEKQREQKAVIILSGLMFSAGFIVAGLTYRFEWYTLPRWAVVTAVVVFLIGYILYAEVIRENKYLSRIIEVQEKQRVIDTGLYHKARQAIEEVYRNTLHNVRICSDRDDIMANHLINASRTLKNQQIYMQNIVLVILELLCPFVKWDMNVEKYQIVRELLEIKFEYRIGGGRCS